MNTGEWVGFSESAREDSLPYDLTTAEEPEMCHAVHPDGYLCTRLRSHTGRHAAGDGDWIVAVWA